MTEEPELIDRPDRTYAAVHRTVAADGFPAVIDAGFPELMRWMSAHGLDATGPALIRYRAEEGDAYVIDLGFPVEGDLAQRDPGAGADGVTIERLPAGRYVRVRHVGAYDGLTEAHAAIDEWAEQQGLTLDDELGLRIEHYVTDPSDPPDPSTWVTEVEQLVTGGPGPA